MFSCWVRARERHSLLVVWGTGQMQKQSGNRRCNCFWPSRTVSTHVAPLCHSLLNEERGLLRREYSQRARWTHESSRDLVDTFARRCRNLQACGDLDFKEYRPFLSAWYLPHFPLKFLLREKNQRNIAMGSVLIRSGTVAEF